MMVNAGCTSIAFAEIQHTDTRLNLNDTLCNRRIGK